MKQFISLLLLCISISGYSQKVNPDLFKSLRTNHLKSSFEIYYNPLLDKYDLTFVKLDLEVSDQSTYIKGSAILQATVKEKLDTLLFDFSDYMTVDSVYLNETKITVLHANNVIRYIFDSPLSINDQFTVQVFYHGTPDPYGGGVTNDYTSTWGKSMTWTLSESFHAYEWWPCKQVLSDKIDSTYIFLTCDNDCKAGSNGLLTNEVDLPNNKKRFEWKSYYPINYYLISYAVSEYQEYNNFAYPVGSDPILIQNYIYDSPGCLDNYKSQIDETPSMIEIFSDKFGLYPFANEKYGHCLTTLGGGMEHQTMTTIGSFSYNLVSHELGHMWFGDYVTCASWQDIWINEGFASYTEYVALENLKSYESAQSWMQATHAGALSQAHGSVYIPFEDAANESRIFSGSLSYDKGAAIIHILRHEINDDDLFFSAIREYLNQYGDSVATGDDFKNVMEQQTDIDLDPFFDQWYYGKGYPQFNVEYTHMNDTLYLNVSETTSSSETPLFQVHVDYKIYYANGDTTLRLYQSENTENFKIPLKHQVTNIEVDPENWILNKEGYIDSIDSPGSNENLFKVYPTITNTEIWLEFNQKLNYNLKEIQIFDLNGRLIKSYNTQDIKYRINTDYLSNGMYLVKAKSNGYEYSYKFIKQ